MSAENPGRAAGYTVDLQYPSRFALGLTPLQMRWNATCAGATPGPLTEPFDYCDLGCGDGSTLNLLAACYPHGRFVGIDINAEHISRGRKEAARSGLTNVSFVNESFSALETLDLPSFDYVAAYGIYSWIDTELQQAVNAFAARHLKPDGLFGVHYSSLPGAFLRDAVSNYLKSLSAVQTGSSAERFTAALSRMQDLVRHSRFFSDHRSAIELFASMTKARTEAAAHDVLNRQAHSFYFSDVNETLAAGGLEFVASADMPPNYPELVLSLDAWSVLNRLTDKADSGFRETTLDMMLNTSQRFDLFRRAESARTSPRSARLANLGTLYLQRVGSKFDPERTRGLAGTTAVDLTAPVFSEVLSLAGSPSVQLAEALESKALASFDPGDVSRAIEYLFALGFLNLLVRPPEACDVPQSSRFRLTADLNTERLMTTIASPTTEWLASPVLGAPLPFPPAERMSLLALTGGDLRLAWDSLSAAYPEFRERAGSTSNDFQRFSAEVRRAQTQFVREAVPQLLSLGVIEVAD